MLPGNAKLRVCFLPFVGLKTADGLEVSTVSVKLASPELSLRFCERSVNCNRVAFKTHADLNMVQWRHFVQCDVLWNHSPMAAFLVKASVLAAKRKREPLGA